MFAVLKQVTAKNIDFAQVVKEMEGSCGKLTVSAVTQRWDRFAKKHWKANSSHSGGKQSVIGNARVTKSGAGKSGGKRGGGDKQEEKVNVKASKEIESEDELQHGYEVKQEGMGGLEIYADNEEYEYYEAYEGMENDEEAATVG